MPVPYGHIWDSFLRVFLGLIFGIIIGVPLGLFMGMLGLLFDVTLRKIIDKTIPWRGKG